MNGGHAVLDNGVKRASSPALQDAVESSLQDERGAFSLRLDRLSRSSTHELRDGRVRCLEQRIHARLALATDEVH